ncbi:MAM and LDL-receptor class A domain-containing protein 1-like [Dermacentor variabilis]|uniref:MAM and LDL-receptor class A domain-containing protein 1-like n=1 Tax=Dermacentor variabilis TaxID=34621 RepID=UPI003F5B7205
MVPDRGPTALTARVYRGELLFATSLVLLFTHVSIAAARHCSFEDGICPDWVSTNCTKQACFQARRVAEMRHGPIQDHTLKTGDGWCAYATTEQPAGGLSVAQLSSLAEGPFCFTGWYHQSGTQDDQVKFYAGRAPGTSKLFYATQRDMAGQWQRVRYSEKRTGQIEIMIRLHVQRSPERGVFALDDLNVESQECTPERPSGSCDFDWDETCGYSLGDGSEIWQYAGVHRQPFHGVDYSTNTDSGGLVYIHAKSNYTRAVLTSPTIPGRKSPHCLQFYYYIHHNSQPQQYLLSATVEGASSRNVWMRSSSELSRGSWTAAYVTFQEEQSFKIKFKCTIRGKKFPHSLCAIDAIWVRGCNNNRATENLCDFENGWCTWSNRVAYLNNSPWILGGGTTKTTLQRPLQDHTFGNATGSYLFFSNFEQNKGNKAELISEILTWSRKLTQCAEFWYIISEDPEMNLEVRAIDTSDDSEKGVPLWAQKGGRSLAWQQGRIAVPHNRRVLFVGTAGGASKPGYIALDDISIVHRDRCETLPQDGEALPATDLLSCSLARWNFCHWSSTAVLSKTWHFGLHPYSSLAPATAPENPKGNIAYLEGTNLNSNQGSVQLYSTMVGPQSELACFSVWYHMFGGRGAVLRLTVVKSPASSGVHTSSPLLFQRGRTTADIWYNVRRTVSLDSVHNKLVFVVSSEKSMNRETGLALGPMNFTSGKCDVLTDGRGYCDFEFDTCDWVVDSGWWREQKSSAHIALDPISGPVNSVFVLTATQRTASPAGATVTSPEWPGQKQPQCIEFWYLPAGKSAALLQVEVVVNGKSEVVWQQPPYTRNEWMLARSQILQEKKFKVAFRAKFSENLTEPISLDDIILRPEPCVHPVQCDFFDGLCGYINKFQGDFRWLVGTGRYEAPRMQPAVPRETDSPSFAYLDLTTGTSDVTGEVADSISATAKAVGLLSPLFDAPDDGTQLSVQYYRNGPDITAANLSISCYGNVHDLVNITAQSYVELTEVSQWTTLNLSLKRGSHCQLSVWVTRGDGTNGTMAIASVQATRTEPAAARKGNSDTPYRCTFEEGTMCGWRPGNFSLKWALNDPSKKSPDFPRFDHTLKAYKGRFAFATNNEDHEPQHAILISPDLDVNATSRACLSLWVFTVHAQHVNLDIRCGGDQLFGTVTHPSHRWNHVIVDFKRPESKFKLWISFYMEPGLVALDDIRIDAGPCPPRDFCSWEVGSPCLIIAAPDSFDAWKIRRAADIRFADHTIKNLTGRYLYLNTTAVHSHHPVSRVFMQRRPPTAATCVTFWWSGHGAPGRLNVYRFTTETALRDPLVSVYSHSQDGEWLARTVTITSSREWNLVFEGVAVAATKAGSGIMIDDVEFTDGECPPYELCSFEDECLPWRIPRKEAAFEVERAGSFEKLPQDHTMQTEEGHYLLFKSPGTKGNRTSLILREPMRYQCITFWYYLPDLSDGVVLYVQDKPILKGNGVWKRYQEEHQTFWEDPIVAVSGLNPKGFTAIDDVFISKLACDETTSSTERFDCGNQTVTIERVCDFVVDCDNGDDERDCGECDFSESLCGWHTNDKLNHGAMSWRRSAVARVENSPPIGADGRRHGEC